MATKRKTKKRPKALRPDDVKYMEIDEGRHRRGGEPVALFARLEMRAGECAISLGMSSDKLQIRVTLEALREVFEAAEAM